MIPKSGLELKKEFSHSLWIGPLILAIENSAVVAIPHPWFVIFQYRGIAIVLGLALLFFGRHRLIGMGLNELPISWKYAGVHVACLIFLGIQEFVLVGFSSRMSIVQLRISVALWLILIAALVVSLLRTFLPFRKMYDIGRSLGTAWAYAAVCSILVVVWREILRLSWDVPNSRLGQFLQTASFQQAKALLEIFYRDVTADPASHVLGTDRFLVEITGACSGIEGLALISAFMLVWFIFARRELRLHRALLLIPAGLILMWSLNIVRLVALICVGSAGYPDVAVSGFHAEAGWIAFTLVSLGFLLLAQRTSWFRKIESGNEGSSRLGQDPDPVYRNDALVYLAPFLALTAASLLSELTSSGIEWLRFIAVAVAIWVFRKKYRGIDWRFGALGICAGIAVAFLWVGAHDALGGWSSSYNSGFGLDLLPHGQRPTWLSLRILTAIVTVPIAEELAFRGFIARRLIAADVESVEFSRLNGSSIAFSSIAFGLMHGQMWASGIVAGIVFAIVARFRGRLGESIAAHAAANLGIVAFAVFRGDSTFWLFSRRFG